MFRWVVVPILFMNPRNKWVSGSGKIIGSVSQLVLVKRNLVPRSSLSVTLCGSLTRFTGQDSGCGTQDAGLSKENTGYFRITILMAPGFSRFSLLRGPAVLPG